MANSRKRDWRADLSNESDGREKGGVSEEKKKDTGKNILEDKGSLLASGSKWAAALIKFVAPCHTTWGTGQCL